jgi:uncharacterized protein YdeI (YjbR/CyaY-like superfamily)
MQKTEAETFYPANQQEWRQWLEENHASKQAVWVVMHKKASSKPSISWSDAVDVALCFGWIDSVKRSVDSESSIQFFSKRKPKSAWSKINKAKIERLIEGGLMTAAGLACIETAKQNSSWTILDEVEELTMPDDLKNALDAQPGAASYFSGLSKSVRKAMLQWVMFAKRPETRQNRINEIAQLAALKQKPKQF